MCGGVEYQDGARTARVFFPQPEARLPVRRRDGGVAWLPWGRREDEAVALPGGGWARLESIQAGKWDRYRPRPVLIPVIRFMEKDRDGRSHWFDVPERCMVQGLLATGGGERRVYVVTVDAPEDLSPLHDRWPRLVEKIPTDHR